MYEVKDFSDIIRNEGPQVLHNGFEKCTVEILRKSKASTTARKQGAI